MVRAGWKLRICCACGFPARRTPAHVKCSGNASSGHEPCALPLLDNGPRRVYEVLPRADSRSSWSVVETGFLVPAFTCARLQRKNMVGFDSSGRATSKLSRGVSECAVRASVILASY